MIVRVSLQIEGHGLSPCLVIELDLVYFGRVRKETKPCRNIIRKTG
jgi:hypothetical protein